VNRCPEHLTEREEQILRCIRRWIAEHGEGPSVRQIAEDVGFSSTSSVAYHLGNLERQRGALVRDGCGWRTCRLAR
jgi:SOS-response transcriptional repressor LexA